MPDAVAREDHELVGGVEGHCPDVGECGDHLGTVTNRLVLLVDVVACQFTNTTTTTAITRPTMITTTFIFIYHTLIYDTGKRKHDDPDGCEWVNVSSGTGLPGLSRIKGR